MLAKDGVHVQTTDLFGRAGKALLDRTRQDIAAVATARKLIALAFSRYATARSAASAAPRDQDRT